MVGQYIMPIINDHWEDFQKDDLIPKIKLVGIFDLGSQTRPAKQCGMDPDVLLRF